MPFSSWTPRALLVPFAAAGLLGACVPATNPCDPNAPDEVRRTATLQGAVVDQDEQPVVGVTVSITGPGGAKTTSTGENGRFSFTDLIPGAFEVAALPEAPLVGGRLTVPDLGCREVIDDLQVVVVRPPSAPEVDLVLATAPDRLFVAFPSAAPLDVATLDDDALAHPGAVAGCGAAADVAPLRYRVEVREPFGAWLPAVVVADPVWSDEDAATPLWRALTHIDEGCARAACGYYTYAFDELTRNANARCAEVVGVVEDGAARHLSPFARYQVRVRAEIDTRGEPEKQQLPPRVSSDASAVPGRLSLTPTAELPVPMITDPELTAEEVAALDDQLRASLDVTQVVPVADGRFALIHDGTLLVAGAGASEARAASGVDGEVNSTNQPVVDDGLFFDDATSASTSSEVAGSGARALAVLPAGQWVRVWKRRAGGDSMVDKVWVGDTWGTAPQNANPDEPVVNIDMGLDALNEAFRGFRWLTIPEGSAIDPDAPYNPPDAYLLYFKQGVAMFEKPSDGSDGLMSDVMNGSRGNGGSPDFYGDENSLLDSPTGVPDGNFAELELCNHMNNGMGVMEDATGKLQYGACFNLATAAGEIDIADVNTLRSHPGDATIEQTVHLFADQQGDRVVFMQTAHLLGTNLPWAGATTEDVWDEVAVGMEPVAFQPSALLTCDGLTELDRSAVMLVANRGSQDVSVLEVGEAPPESPLSLSVEEGAVVALPAVPERFFVDADGPSCENPYSWIVGEGGILMPIDMRVGSLGVPECGDEPCAVQTRSRARAGGVSRNLEGRSRVLIGGQGMLSEIGFLRPSRVPALGR